MRLRVRARFLQTLVCAGCVLALPGTALAGGSPVHIDPSSPVAKEYALPLATARGAPPESGKSGKLFGSGIKHASSTTLHVRSAPAPPPTTRSTVPSVTTSPTAPPAATAPTAPPAATSPTPPPATTPPSAQPSTEVTTTTVPAPTETHGQSRSHRRHHPEHVTTVTLPALTTAITQTVTRPATARATPAAYRVLRPGSGSGLLWMALAALVVVAVGSAGGFALSRRR